MDNKRRLNEHPIFNSINTVEQLRTFMEHHVFAVWDFMCLAKSLQKHIAPANNIWVPPNSQRARLINEIILGEETDVFNNGHISHFEMYIYAMEEIGADTTAIYDFIDLVQTHGLEQAYTVAPPECVEFMRSTFEFIDTEQPHIIASAFANGRETIIPAMFKKFLVNKKVKASTFDYYLARHIEVDTSTHGPAAIRMVNNLCMNNKTLEAEAEQASERAITARLKFWDSIMDKL